MDGDTPNDAITSLEAALLFVQSALDTGWSWLVGTFFVPGDYVLALLLGRAPALAARLGVGEDAFGGLYSALLSAVCWMAALVLLLAGFRAARNGLAVLAGFVRSFLVAARHRQRMIRNRLGTPVRKIRRSLRPNRTALEEFQIDALQMAIMNQQARLAPGHVITALDVAHDLKVRPGRAQQALDQLKRLHLVEVSFGTTDGYPGYLLTKPGQVFLASYARGAAAARPRSGLHAR